MPELRVTQNTSVKDLHDFTSQLGDNDTVRGKKNDDGSITLYVKTKKKSLGIANFFFNSRAKRRENAREAVQNILFRNTPRPAGQAGQDLDFAMVNLLSDIPRGDNEFKGSALRAIGDIAFDAQVTAEFPQHLPRGVQVDAQGNLTGGQTITTVPHDCKTQAMDFAGQPLVTALTENKLDPNKLSTVAGQKIVNQATKDFFRLQFDIPQPGGGAYRSAADTEQREATRNENATRALRNFAGSDNATTVLSAMLTQTTLTPIPGCLAKSDGSLAEYRVLTSQNTNGREMTIRDANGKHSIDPQFVGGAEWSLSELANGDFKISIDWQTYCEAPKGSWTDGESNKVKHELLPLHKDGCIGVHYTMDFVVDRQEADAGRLSVTMPNDVRADFSGRVLV